MSALHIKQKSVIHGEVESLPSSKSLSNRALILQALAGNQPVVSNLSNARDTVLMNRLISSEEKVMDVMDAGTTMRFLTAFFAISGKNKILTGTPRMKERPIGLLVDALRKIGASIDYLEKEGFPPMETKGFTKQLTAEVSIPGNISSQYISALMMIGPVLPQGITIRLTGKVGSRPYINMTAELMRHFGVACDFRDDVIQIMPGKYRPAPYRVESDWSGASYWFAFAALAEESTITLPDVAEYSLQGDRAIVEIMDKIGVKTTFKGVSAILEKSAEQTSLEWDFTNCPDLAQTVLPVCAAKGIQGKFTGLESLLIKESDRVSALHTELGKTGASLVESTTGTWILTPGKVKGMKQIEVNTYHDHRMAMCLAPLATLMDVIVIDPDVVRKSYPTYWDDMRGLGFFLTELD